MIRIYSHPIACGFLLVLLPVSRTIVECATGVVCPVAILAAPRWTNWCLRCWCVPSREALDEAAIVSLDSDPLSLVSGVCLAMTCWCGKGEEDDNQKKWEVLRNI